MNFCDESVQISVSFVEIYNEYIRDLLKSKNKKNLALRESASKGVVIRGAKTVQVSSVQEIMNLLMEGNARRRTESTGANKVSSRSHAIF